MKTWALLHALFLASPVTDKPTTVVLVMQQTGTSAATDLKLRDHLAALGFAVRLADQDADLTPARDADLVVISSRVSSKDVKPGRRNLAVPLVTWESDLLDDLAVSGKRHDVDFGETAKERFVWIVNASQAIAAGCPQASPTST